MLKAEASARGVLKFWGPLASTWILMAIEGPFLAALIARLDRPVINLAAFGVAYGLALVAEAPVIMLMSAATALVRDRASFEELRRFSLALVFATTAAFGLLLIPAVFRPFAEGLIGLSAELSETTRQACILLMPWPGAIAYRRFYQGVMIAGGQTRRVAYGTLVRLVAMASAGLLAAHFGLGGARVGAIGLAAGVSVEALASRILALHSMAALRKGGSTRGQRWLLIYYWPLALTATLSLSVQPMVTFFLGRSAMALESLAVFPVVLGFVFLFRSLGLAYQDVAIALSGPEHRPHVARFGRRLAAWTSSIVALTAITPLAALWYGVVGGLEPALVELCRWPTLILALMPALTTWFSYLRAMAIVSERTAAISRATMVEVTIIAIVLGLGILVFNLVGAIAGALALILGRCTSATLLWRWLGDTR